MQQKTWSDLKTGDSVWASNGHEIKITSVKKVFELENHNIVLTMDELKTYNYSPTPPPLTLTKQQIADKFGVDISNLIVLTDWSGEAEVYDEINRLKNDLLSTLTPKE